MTTIDVIPTATFRNWQPRGAENMARFNEAAKQAGIPVTCLSFGKSLIAKGEGFNAQADITQVTPEMLKKLPAVFDDSWVVVSLQRQTPKGVELVAMHVLGTDVAVPYPPGYIPSPVAPKLPAPVPLRTVFATSQSNGATLGRYVR